jgi:hypothetical protein
MSAEDHNRDPSTHVDPAVEEHNLDSLARGLASGSISRRQAVRWMGGALLGSVLAIVPGVEAFAAPKPPQGRCPKGFVNCRGTCVKTESNPSHCGGCFIQCSPNEVCTSGQCCAPERVCGGSQCCGADESCCDCGDGSPVCCPSGTYCAGCGPTICCPFDQAACGGQCVSTDCPEGQAFNTSTCQCEANAPGCTESLRCGGPFPQCASGHPCYCVESAEGPIRCGNADFFCGQTPPCSTSAECETLLGPGSFCQSFSAGCCGQVCVPACGSATSTLSSTSTGQSNLGSAAS